MLTLVTAIIKPHRLEFVREALQSAGVTGMTVSEVQGFGRQGGHSETYRGAEYVIDFIPKIKVEVLIESDMVDSVIDLIRSSAGSGQIGDGKIWATSIDRAVRIRTGEVGVDAV